MPSLSNLQLFILPHTESLSRSSTTSARIYFLSGPRLIAYLGNTHSLLTSTAATLSCGPALVPERVEQVVEDRKRATKRVEDTESELASLLSKEMLRSAGNGKDAPIVLHNHRIDDTSNALGFLSSISTALINEITSLFTPGSQYLIVLSSSPSTQTSSSTTVVMIFGTDEKKVKEVGDSLKSKLGVKGGGKGTKWSGKFTGVWKGAREGATVEEAIA
ncbi:hypothetical protein PHLCEN_2v9362 [Hermanssonia centrifuga]|uniref:Uncharacterized protein n=1 Tax=Hermanssonia centrifuga TaxID=98765 RepID=A0A2R6NR18_9APHY|nr:hypothetical protein PHLCEN_2v9362 [Hermanssonia centrifuga]